ncbi:MAG: IPT/TIG domain-containing protein [Janthinobacterium lividum]
MFKIPPSLTRLARPRGRLATSQHPAARWLGSLLLLLCLLGGATTVSHAQALTISSFSPGSGSVGTSVTIFGTGFSGYMDVYFGSSSSYSSGYAFGSTNFSVNVPTGAQSGTLRVVRKSDNVQATSTSTFTFVPPTIYVIFPDFRGVGHPGYYQWLGFSHL